MLRIRLVYVVVFVCIFHLPNCQCGNDWPKGVIRFSDAHTRKHFTIDCCERRFLFLSLIAWKKSRIIFWSWKLNTCTFSQFHCHLFSDLHGSPKVFQKFSFFFWSCFLYNFSNIFVSLTIFLAKRVIQRFWNLILHRT